MTMLGKIPWNKGKTFPHSEEWEKKRLEAVRKTMASKVHARGYHRPIEHTRPMLQALALARIIDPEKFKSLAIKNLPKDVSGEKNGNWRGGLAKISESFRTRNFGRLRKWRESVLKRDDFKCKECGASRSKNGYELDANHIVGIAENPGAAFLRMNGVSLCRQCHAKTDNYGARSFREGLDQIGSLRAIIKVIPHRWQDYPTVGNWGVADDGCLIIFVSDMANESYEFLVAVHELCEAFICQQRGITQKDVEEFDQNFELERAMGIHGMSDEPGDDPASPYHFAHFSATTIERMLSSELEVEWARYEKAVNDL